jgi:hypothetical protein
MYPGNPDLDDGKSGVAYMLTRRADVKHALVNFSMRPYTLGGQFILSMDDVDQHKIRRQTLVNALPPEPIEAMNLAINNSWSMHIAQCESGKEISLDVRAFAREVALRFAADFVGLPVSIVLSAGLQNWSAKGYDNFIWKIHARHFEADMPDLQGSLKSIAKLIGQHASSAPANSVIHRLFKNADPFSQQEVVANIVGTIQGLVDNVMTGACYALNGILQSSRSGASTCKPDKTAAPCLLEQAMQGIGKRDTTALKNVLHLAHQADTPSPFLPRVGCLSDLPSASECGIEVSKMPANFTCAIGAAINDPAEDPETAADAWDIRVGYGRHLCIGRDIGDELMARIIAKVLLLDKPVIETPLEKKWGWIVEKFSISGHLPA